MSLAFPRAKGIFFVTSIRGRRRIGPLGITVWRLVQLSMFVAVLFGLSSSWTSAAQTQVQQSEHRPPNIDVMANQVPGTRRLSGNGFAQAERLCRSPQSCCFTPYNRWEWLNPHWSPTIGLF